MLATAPFDAAILDAAVIDGSTEEVARQLKATSVPFVLYTGSPEKLGKQHEGVEQLSKPVANADLIAALTAVLQKQTQSPDLRDVEPGSDADETPAS